MHSEEERIREEMKRAAQAARMREMEYRYKVRRAQKRRFWSLLTSMAVALVAAFASLYFELPSALKAALIAAATGSAGALGLFYLQSSREGVERFRIAGGSEQAELMELRHLVWRAYQEIEQFKGKSIQFTEEEKKTILSNIQDKLETEAFESYLKSLKEVVESNIKENTLLDSHADMVKRLRQELSDQGRRGNLNLMLGIITTLSGLVVLGYNVLHLPISSQYSDVLVYFVPRVSLVLLIEIFAYFFLKLYKQSLAEIKYFQNELTNVESRYLALQVALQHGDEKATSDVISALAGVERNFVLSKGQTTVDLEKHRNEKEMFVGASNALTEFLKKNK